MEVVPPPLTLCSHHIILQCMDEVENPHFIKNYCQRFTLFHPLLHKDCSIAALQHHNFPVLVCVEFKAGACQPAVAHMLDHGSAVYFVELITF